MSHLAGASSIEKALAQLNLEPESVRYIFEDARYIDSLNVDKVSRGLISLNDGSTLKIMRTKSQFGGFDIQEVLYYLDQSPEVQRCTVVITQEFIIGLNRDFLVLFSTPLKKPLKKDITPRSQNDKFLLGSQSGIFSGYEYLAYVLTETEAEYQGSTYGAGAKHIGHLEVKLSNPKQSARVKCVLFGVGRTYGVERRLLLTN